MSLLCSKFYNGSHFIQSKSGSCSFRAEQKVFPGACTFSVGCLTITSPASLLLFCSLTRWQPHWRLRYSLNVPGILPPQTVPSAPHALPPGLASSPPSSLYSNVISLKPDMTYFNCNPYILVPYPSLEMCASPWHLLSSDCVFYSFFCLLSVSPQ